jgi:hypothetical protein
MFPLSQRMSEYMTSILIPSFFFGRTFESVGVLLAELWSDCIRRRMAGLDVVEVGFGVRGCEEGGGWNAYVTKRESARMTS